MVRTIVSWNVNGLRQRHAQNGFLPLFRHNPDFICIQEAKIPREKVPPEIRRLHGYYLACAPVAPDCLTEVMIFSREKPRSIRYGLGTSSPGDDGRVITADFGTFLLVNIYFPLGTAPSGTLESKLAFFDAFLAFAGQLAVPERPVVICGDFTVAHTDNDMESTRKYSGQFAGTLQAEREKMDQLIRAGYSDALRLVCPEKGHYTWWPNGFRVIDRRHHGRRLDYFFVNAPAKPLVVDCRIQSGVEGSDHCPVELEITV